MARAEPIKGKYKIATFQRFSIKFFFSLNDGCPYYSCSKDFPCSPLQFEARTELDILSMLRSISMTGTINRD